MLRGFVNQFRIKYRLSPLSRNWLHKKGIDHSGTNPFYAASFLCGAACRRLDRGQDEGVQAVQFLIQIGLFPDVLNLERQKDKYDFNTMMNNTLKVSKLVKTMYLDEKVYIHYVFSCVRYLMRK